MAKTGRITRRFAPAYIVLHGMQLHNLEGIGYNEAVNDRGISYAQYRETLSPRYHRVALDIGKGYLFLVLLSTAIFLLDRNAHSWFWLFVPLGALLLGYTAAYLALFLHEAGHYNIHPVRKTNDRLATWFLGIPFGISIKAYRKIHWQHHLHLGTTADTEVSYFHALRGLFFLETLTGVHLLRTLFRKDKADELTTEQKKQGRLLLAGAALFHGALLGVAIGTGYWTVALSWAMGFGVFFPFFASLRQVLEHRDELARHDTNFFKQPHGKISRLFVHSWSSSSFGSAGFTRHMLHHWDPQVSYTRLDDVEKFLEGCARTAPVIRASRTRYTTVFRKLLASP